MERNEREVRVAEIAALDQPVRRDLYAMLVERDGWVGRDEAAEMVGVPRSVAAFHLDKLVEAGLLDVVYERPPGRRGPGAGRPAKKYRRTARDIAVSLPDRSYELAGRLLAEAIEDAAATGRPIEAALGAAARRTGREMGTAMSADTTPAPLSALERLGYEPHRRGGEIVLANCPFHTLAEHHRDLVCAMNLVFLTGLAEGLGAKRTLAPRLAPTDGMCCVRLKDS
jgi:predicted ArsR family transcriptional regulator